MSGWQKREVSGNLVILGDDEGHQQRASGLLAAIRPDPRYPDNKRYTLVQQDGTELDVAGSASINCSLGLQDVGHFVKLVFTGWEKGRNGRFKKIEVQVHDGENLPEKFRAWPRWAELNKAKLPPAMADDGADDEEAKDEDFDLPF